ncbi:T9SS type A sorting domain-containing protein [bacterium]|nr:T9SS type A sorting domain-containing protein [bacterium]
MAVLFCHNSSIADPIQITITSEHIEDTWLNNALDGQMLNYGAHGGAIAGYEGSVYLLRLINLEEAIGSHKIITSCSLFVYISNADGNSGDKTVGIKRVFKPWIAGYLNGIDPQNGEGCTYEDWNADDLEWGLPGCHFEDDDGIHNSGDGMGADCMQTPEDEITVPQTSAYPWVVPGFFGFVISPELINDWYRETIPNNGLVIKTTGPWGWVHTWQADYAFENMRPYLEIEYEVALEIALTLLTSPLVIPASGGLVEFTLDVSNTSIFPETFDIWALVENYSQGGMMSLSARERSLAPQGTLQTDVGIYIPGRAPSGSYLVTVFVGDYPDDFCNSDLLAFEKSAADGSLPGNSLDDWHCSSDLFDSIDINAPEMPISPELVVNAYPNPFNPTTVIRFQIPVSSLVSLTVYDISGREIAELMGGHREAGNYEVVFDGSNLSTGIYFYRIQTGEHSTTRKMVLMK